LQFGTHLKGGKGLERSVGGIGEERLIALCGGGAHQAMVVVVMGLDREGWGLCR
jgi:hypothetical protein